MKGWWTMGGCKLFVVAHVAWEGALCAVSGLAPVIEGTIGRLLIGLIGLLPSAYLGIVAILRRLEMRDAAQSLPEWTATPIRRIDVDDIVAQSQPLEIRDLPG